MVVSSKEKSNFIAFFCMGNKLVQKIDLDMGNSVIFKEMLPCFDLNFCRNKSRFTDHLIAHGISVPKIISLFNVDNTTIEVQECLHGKHVNKIDLQLIKALAMFHNASYLYSGEFNQAYYKVSTVVKNIKLDKLLLGFKEKFYTFPVKNVSKLINDNSLRISILKKYKQLYLLFAKEYGFNDCIIHNDLTSNNYLKDRSTYSFIDFDLSIKSSIYVDFVDLLLTRDFDINDYFKIFTSYKSKICEYIDGYNSIASVKQLTFDGFSLMAALKLLSYYFYLHVKSNGIIKQELFNVLKFVDYVIKEVIND